MPGTNYQAHFHDSVYGPVHTGSGDIVYRGAEHVASSNRQKFLDKVNRFWIKGVLKDSLHDATLIGLEKEVVKNAIDHTWQDVVHQAESKTEPLLANQSIWNFFDNMDQALLILGAPGAGKTTALLDLAREAHKVALADPMQPMPVYLNLSSWRGETFIAWLIAQLSQRYQIPEGISRLWLEQRDQEGKENNQLILLLDGLDEVAPQYQKACVIAINKFRKAGNGRYLAISCREQIYNDLQPLKLSLDGSIRLKPLTLTQIDEFLTTVAPELGNLREDLEKNRLLWELASKPLMLNVMVTVYQDDPIINLEQFNSADALGRFLFEQYTSRMFKRVRKDPKSFSEVEVRKTLSWLAKNLSSHNQPAFLLENLQPSWLTTQRRQKHYVLVSRMVTAVALGFLFDGPLAGWVIGILGGGIVGLIINSQLRQRDTPDNNRITSKRTFLIMALVGGLIVGPAGGLAIGIIIRPILEIYGTGSLRYSMAITLLFGTALIIIRGLIYGLVFGSSGRGKDIREDIQRRELLAWSWEKALIGWGVGLGTGLIISLLVGIAFGGAVSFLSNLTAGITFGIGAFITTEFVYGLLGGLFGGLRGIAKDIDDIEFPGGGLQTMFKNAAVAGTAVGSVSGLLLGTTGALLIIIIVGLIMEQWLVAAFFAPVISIMLAIGLGFTVGGLAALWFGGIDLIQHHTLRLLLRFDKTIPTYHIVNLLDYATERILLRRVGGAYIFIHPLLQEYFAEHEQR